MKSLMIVSIAMAITAGATEANARPLGDPLADRASGLIQLAGNTSSNSSSNTSSNSSGGRSTVVHTHNWSVHSDDGHRRRSVRGTTYIDRHFASPQRYRAQRRDRRHRDDD